MKILGDSWGIAGPHQTKTHIDEVELFEVDNIARYIPKWSVSPAVSNLAQEILEICEDDEYPNIIEKFLKDLAGLNEN